MPYSKTSLAKPVFVSIEGVDGVGKSTVLGLVRTELRKARIPTIDYKIPAYGQTFTASLLKTLFRIPGYLEFIYVSFPEIHTLLIAADTLFFERKLRQNIANKTSQPLIILGDRSVLANYAYSGGKEDGLRKKLSDEMRQSLFKRSLRPDMAFLLHTSLNTVEHRLNSKGEYLSDTDKVRLATVQDRYLKLFNGGETQFTEGIHTELIDADRRPEDIASELSKFIRTQCGCDATC